VFWVPVLHSGFVFQFGSGFWVRFSVLRSPFRGNVRKAGTMNDGTGTLNIEPRTEPEHEPRTQNLEPGTIRSP